MAIAQTLLILVATLIGILAIIVAGFTLWRARVRRQAARGAGAVPGAERQALVPPATMPTRSSSY